MNISFEAVGLQKMKVIVKMCVCCEQYYIYTIYIIQIILNINKASP